MKMRYDNKMALLQEETQATQTQLEKARRERDTLRQFNCNTIPFSSISLMFCFNRDMLDGAQRMITELKADPMKREKPAAHSLEVRIRRVF